MRRRTLSVLLIGGILCLVPLAWFQHTLGQRSARHWTGQAELAANRLCRALRAADLVLAERFPADSPDGADDLLQLVSAEGLERILSLPGGTEAARPASSPPQGRPAAEVTVCPSAPGLAAATLLRGSADRSAVLYLGSPLSAAPGGAGWIRLDGVSLLGRPQEGLLLVALAPWPAAGPPPLPAAARVWRVVHGPHSLLLALGQVADPDERLERSWPGPWGGWACCSPACWRSRPSSSGAGASACCAPSATIPPAACSPATPSSATSNRPPSRRPPIRPRPCCSPSISRCSTGSGCSSTRPTGC